MRYVPLVTGHGSVPMAPGIVAGLLPPDGKLR
jgi:hypothetical protein